MVRGRLVDTLEGRDGLALVLVEGGVNDATVLDVDVWLGRVGLPCEGVLHPLLVITLGTKNQHANNSQPS